MGNMKEIRRNRVSCVQPCLHVNVTSREGWREGRKGGREGGREQSWREGGKEGGGKEGSKWEKKMLRVMVKNFPELIKTMNHPILRA